jgi:hypothetical protein
MTPTCIFFLGVVAGACIGYALASFFMVGGRT